MYHDYNEKRKTPQNNGRNRTAQSGKLAVKENYKFLGILEADTTMQTKMKEKTKKEFLRRTSNLFETKR